MAIRVHEDNKVTEYGQTDTHHYIKSTTHVSDKQVSDNAEMNTNIKENRPAGTEMRFEGRIPLWLYENVKNRIFNAVTKNASPDEQAVWLTKAGQNQISNWAIDEILTSNEYSRVMGR